MNKITSIIIALVLLLCQAGPGYADNLRPASAIERSVPTLQRAGTEAGLPCPENYFSQSKLNRYIEGPNGIFRDSPEIMAGLRQIFESGLPRIVTKNGRAVIEIDYPRMYFLTWYERRFGLISPDKPSTFMRGYVHDLFHIMLSRHNFSSKLYAAFKPLPPQLVADFLNNFNSIFGVIRDASGTPAEITPQFLSDGTKRNALMILLEEVGAKYMSGMYEDRRLHAVYSMDVSEFFRTSIQPSGPVPIAAIIENFVDEAVRNAHPELSQASLYSIANSGVTPQRLIALFWYYLDMSEEADFSILGQADGQSNQLCSALKMKIRSHPKVNDIPQSERRLPVDIAWTPGIGAPYGEWKFELASEEPFDLSAVQDAIECAIYRDENNILTSSLSGAFGTEVPLSNIKQFRICQYQEGRYGGIFLATVRAEIGGVEKEGSFIINASKSVEYNSITSDDFRHLKRLRDIDPRYVCRVYGDCAVKVTTSRGPRIIRIFTDEMLNGFWEISAARQQNSAEYPIAPGYSGMGVMLNKGGEHGARGESLGGLGAERFAKTKMIEIATIYTDPEQLGVLKFAINAGDFLCRIPPGGPPQVRLSSAREFVPFQGKPSESLGGLIVFYTAALATFFANEETDIAFRAENPDAPPEVMREYSAPAFEPEEVLRGFLAGLVSRYGERRAVRLAVNCLSYYKAGFRDAYFDVKPAIFSPRYLTAIDEFLTSIRRANSVLDVINKPDDVSVQSSVLRPTAFGERNVYTAHETVPWMPYRKGITAAAARPVREQIVWLYRQHKDECMPLAKISWINTKRVRDFLSEVTGLSPMAITAFINDTVLMLEPPALSGRDDIISAAVMADGRPVIYINQHYVDSPLYSDKKISDERFILFAREAITCLKPSMTRHKCEEAAVDFLYKDAKLPAPETKRAAAATQYDTALEDPRGLPTSNEAVSRIIIEPYPNGQAGRIVRKQFVAPFSTIRMMFFRQEGRILKLLYEAGIAKDVLEMDPLDFRTKFVEGFNVAEWQEANDEEYVREHVRKLFNAIFDKFHAIHDIGIIHRDIKPQHIIITGDLDVHVIDFGIAYIDDPGERVVEREDEISGTLSFLPPEILSGKGGGRIFVPAYDVCSLGYTMIKFFVGSVKPFRDIKLSAGEGVLNAYNRGQIMRKTVVKEGDLLPEWEEYEGLAEFLTKAVDPDPARRFQDMKEMEREFNRIMDAAEARGWLLRKLTGAVNAALEFLSQDIGAALRGERALQGAI